MIRFMFLGILDAGVRRVLFICTPRVRSRACLDSWVLRFCITTRVLSTDYCIICYRSMRRGWRKSVRRRGRRRARSRRRRSAGGRSRAPAPATPSQSQKTRRRPRSGRSRRSVHCNHYNTHYTSTRRRAQRSVDNATKQAQFQCRRFSLHLPSVTKCDVSLTSGDLFGTAEYYSHLHSTLHGSGSLGPFN